MVDFEILAFSGMQEIIALNEAQLMFYCDMDVTLHWQQSRLQCKKTEMESVLM